MWERIWRGLGSCLGGKRRNLLFGKILELSGDMELGEFKLGLPESIVEVWAKSTERVG